MDKFGIFNILNSLLGSKNTSDSFNKEQSSGLNSLLGALTPTPNQTPPQEKNTSTPPLPLQESMISTMNRHDEFIKRVKNKNKIKD